MQQRKFVKTTLGDLIVAITDEARNHTHNRREGSALTASIITDILERCNHQSRRSKSPAARRTLPALKGKVSPISELVAAAAGRLYGAPKGSLHVATQ